MKKIYCSILIFTAFMLPQSCVNDCGDCNFPPVRAHHTRVLFHYLAMDNNLVSYGRRNISDMYAGATADNLNGGAIVVFSDMRSDPFSCLLYMYADRNGVSHLDTLYKWEANLDSSDPQTFTAALDKTRTLITADSWALGTGSHGSGWMPAELHPTYLRTSTRMRTLLSGEEQPWYIRDPFNETEPQTRALLNDGANYMEIDELVNIIPDGLFDFVMMDICYMGSVEFAYAMRNKTKQLVLSPAEVIAYGMPYDRIIQYIFANTPELGQNGVCDAYNDFYSDEFSGGGTFATIALYDCSKLGAFAETMEGILAPLKSQIGAMTKTNLNTLQTFDRNSLHTMFDLREFVYSLYPDGDPVRAEFETALSEVVTYCKTSGYMLSPPALTIPEDRFCGISTYVPIGEYGDLNAYYWQTAWGSRVYNE